ncbi:MAG: methionyl-tRNA formyltransferase [Bacteroidales bacterium]|nr:methionyl-tRNA formyltransferase [Bacteroidales bacterium]
MAVSKSVRIVFMGTPEFAVASLGSLLMNGYNVVGVVTVPDKPAGRGRATTRSAVKQFSEFSYLPLLQPENLKDPEFLKALKSLKPDIIVVVAFRFLPEEVWSIPSLGTFNLHASLLPDYRGAAPINHAVINGEHTTGVTTFLIDHNIDTGNILLREEVPIFTFENAGDLHDRLMRVGARVVTNTVKSMVEGSLKPLPQSHFIRPGDVIKPAPKIFPRNTIIDWKLNPCAIHNMVRGLSPAPCAKSGFTKGDEQIIFKVYETHPEIKDHAMECGTLETDGKHYIRIACSGGFINLISLQLAGRKRMSTVELLRGFRAGDYSITTPVL